MLLSISLSSLWPRKSPVKKGHRNMILVVDDHHDSRQALLRLLHLEGFEARGAVDGHQALEMIRAHRPKVVVLDQDMPDMTGTDLLRILKCDPDFADIPVLFYTATSPFPSRAEAMRLGASDWIIKATISWKDLREKIEDACAPRKSAPRALAIGA
jgi:CheY-like chemotaxis protein